MEYSKTSFKKEFIVINNDIKLNYYSSPLLNNFKFIHAFFTKESHEFSLNSIANGLPKENINCSLNQVHSNILLLGSNIHQKEKSKADGIISDAVRQNLWIYTADCLPILFADKQTRRVAAIHCGRLGLEKKIIRNTISLLEELGSNRQELLVAIGPSISKINYLLEAKYIKEFDKRINFDEAGHSFIDNSLKKNKDISDLPNVKDLHPLDLHEFAFKQLCKEKIPIMNIEIAEKCTYETPKEFHSWRRTKTYKRNWSFISN